ncbi:hypothetical protein MMC10_011392 [Thelotrema lepadinum]|nr:hypothetical protein [Thelotrema lepadinum]
MSPLPPRKIQERLVERWELQATENNDIAAVSKACFELSICYYLGFGVEQDYVVSHKFLQQACYGSSIAKAILGRVTPVFKMLKSGEGVPRSHFGKGSSTYFADRVRSVRSEIILRRDLTETPRLSLRVSHNSDTWRVQLITQLIEQELMRSADVAEAMDIDRLDELWEECAREQSLPLESLSQAAISAALTEACRLGSFKVAKSLATLCLQYIGRYGEPNPLHWLMMFPPEEAQFMAKLLVLGPKDKSSFPGGICFRCLNARTSSVVFLPEHCMELVGAPLHWAVRSRNLEIVETLLDLGADLTLRCKLRAQLPGEPPNIARVTYNPLDIALEYHLYDIVNVLLIRGQGQKLGKSMEVGASLVAHTATPFSRLVIHGSSYRFALQKTVQTLSDMGWPLDRPDFFGEIPLIASLTNTAQEEYIIQELLRTCPQVVERGLPKGDNLAISVVLSAETDHPSTAWKLQQVVHQVQDLNACNDAGFNALHYCALIGNAPMTEVLLSTSRVDINAESRNQYRSTPLLQAAQFGRTGVLTILLEAGVDPNSSNEMGDTALELSVLNRQYDTASMLIERGACLDFGVHNSVPRSTVLHAACIQCSNRPPLVRQLLMGHAKLRDRNVLHRVTRGPVGGAQTPLHGAVLLGDLDSVKALLEFGADPSFWICPPGLEASDKFSMTLYKMTPLDLVNFTLQRAASKGLPSEQLKVARQGRSDLMRHILMNENFDKRQERLEWEHFDGAPQFNFRLEDLQLAKQGQAGERDFLARLEEMKRLMEEKLKCKQP